MKSITTILTAVGTLLMLTACHNKHQSTDDSPFAPGQERPLVIRPVVSSAAITRATTDPVAVTLTGGNLALTLSRNATAGAPTQTAVYTTAAPLAYAHQATVDTLVKRGICATPEEAARKARALYVTEAGAYPLAALGTPNAITTLSDGTTLPFAIHARRTAADDPIAVAANGNATLPLHIASAGVMLRMKYKTVAKESETSIRINSVRCLPTGETAPHKRDNKTDEVAATASRVVTATTPSGSDGIATDHVLFGTLAPGQELTAGSTLVEINATLTTRTGSDNIEEKKVFTVALPRAVTPQAGQLLTYTVQVNHTFATIVGDVLISDFVPGNGSNGEDIGIGTVATASGLEPLDPTLFNEKNPVWVVTGGGTPEADNLVLKNVRDALDRIYPALNAEGYRNPNPYTGTARIDLQLPEVTSIPIYDIEKSIGAFHNYKQLHSISALRATSIGDYAFQGCAALTTIDLPGVTGSIGDRAFLGCTALTTVKLPGVTSIGDEAFWNCEKLTAIDLPVATSIGVGAFRHCKALTTIEMPGVTGSIGDNAFFGCEKLETIDLPKVTGSIGMEAFIYCSALTTIKLPGAKGSIGNNAFEGCKALTNIEMPGVTGSIGDRAFFGCEQLTNIEMPEAKGSIGNNAFLNCTALTSIKLPGATGSIGKFAFNGCKALTTIEMPGVTGSIGDNAFTNCTALTTIKLPGAKGSIGGGAFAYCSALTHLELPEVTGSIGEAAFRGCKVLATIKLPKVMGSIGEAAFGGCTTLAHLELPGVTGSIGKFAFEGCELLTNIEMPGVTGSIGDRAFEGCAALTTINLPKVTGSIGNNAFGGCTTLAHLELTGVTSIGEQAFLNCKALTSLELTAAGNITLDNIAFNGFNNSACDLVLNPDKKIGGAGTPNVTADGKWGASGKELEWKSITHAAPAK